MPDERSLFIEVFKHVKLYSKKMTSRKTLRSRFLKKISSECYDSVTLMKEATSAIYKC